MVLPCIRQTPTQTLSWTIHVDTDTYCFGSRYETINIVVMLVTRVVGLPCLFSLWEEPYLAPGVDEASWRRGTYLWNTQRSLGFRILQLGFVIHYVQVSCSFNVQITWVAQVDYTMSSASPLELTFRQFNKISWFQNQLYWWSQKYIFLEQE